MEHGRLRVRRVRRYRAARYPSQNREARARRGGPVGERLLRAAAGPAAVLGLGAAGAGCNGGVNLVGTGRDATDAATPDVAVEDSAEDLSLCTEYVHTTPVAIGACLVRYLREAEGRAAIAGVVEEVSGTPTDPCAHPTLHERLATDVPLTLGGLEADIDLLAPAGEVGESPPCPDVHRPAVGFEFMTDEAGDDQERSGNAAGLTDAEEAELARLRAAHEVGIAPLRARDYPYRFLELMGGGTDDSDRLRAEELLRSNVRALLDDLRRDGML